MKILLINPPIYDFSAYDFWMRPYGLLRVGGYLRKRAELHLFDFMDRSHPAVAGCCSLKQDVWGRGQFYSEIVSTPQALRGIRRHYRRFGIPAQVFQEFLEQEGPFQWALIQTGMTYWYPGIQEVLRLLGRHAPQTRTALGGVYATLCSNHARSLGADLVISGSDLKPLWDALQCVPDLDEVPFWEGFPRLSSGVLKLGEGCPFRCTYCSVPQVYGRCRPRSLAFSAAELEHLIRLGVVNLVFYDDALLFAPDAMLIPFLDWVRNVGFEVHFHTPNALNARFVTARLARRMVAAGFRHFFLGFESGSRGWQRSTGGKVASGELAAAVNHLLMAGADPKKIVAYLIVGHPANDRQDVEVSLRFAHTLGIQTMLSEFSPVPGTPDGEYCRRWTDLDEPLNQNKTAFTRRFLGHSAVQRLKHLCNEFNQKGRRNLEKSN